MSKSSSSSLDRAFEDAPEAGATDEEYGEYTVARYAIQNPHYAGLYQVWTKSIFFIVGKQWLKWNEEQATFAPDTDVPTWRQQPVTNWTYATYRTLLAKLTKQRPTLEVVPPSGDSEDQAAAKLGEAIVEFLWRHLKSPQKVMRALAWFLSTGNFAFNVDWDPTAGEVRPRTVLVEVADPETPGETIDVECACDEEGEPARRTSTGPEDLALDGGEPYDLEAEPEMEPIGEIEFDVDDPLSYRFNPEASCAEDATEMFVAHLLPRAKVARDYDIAEDDLFTTAGDSESDRESIDDVLSSMAAGAPDPFNNKGERTGGSQFTGGMDRVLVIKYYAAPDAKGGFPKGRHWITAGGMKVWPKADDPAFPDGEAEIPFGFWPPRVVVIDTPIPGQPQGLGIIPQVVPLNEKYNFLDGKIGEYHTLQSMGGVTWVGPLDRGIQITSEPGQVKVSRQYGADGRHPIREPLTALPGPVYAERELIANNLRTIAGLSQIDMGQKPEGVSAGRAFLVMQEASDSAIMPTLMAFEAALEEVGRRQLIIAQQKYTEPRTIKIRGDKGKWEFRSFTAADLCDGLDVRVQVGSSFPWSKSAQWDTKLNLLTTFQGLVLKPDGSVDQEKLAKFLDAGAPGLAAFETDEDADLVEIEREHAMFEEYDPADPAKSNELPQLAVWQNQPKHQTAHFEFMKRSYARFSRWSPAAQMAFIEHLRLTTEAVDQLAQQALGMGAGAPPGATAPSPDAPAGPGPQLVPSSAPTAPAPGSATRLTRGDRAAAGQ